MKVDVQIFTHDMSDPHERFVMVGLRVTRDDGTQWAVRGERVHEREPFPAGISAAIASAVENLLAEVK